MTRKTRTFLFIFFVLLFAIAVPSLVFYAQGYRVNWPLEPGKNLVVMTGGLYVETTPKQASIYVNDKLKKQTDFFLGSALVENLVPRQYRVQVKKAGYQTWQKNLEIKGRAVTEAINIFLFPEEVTFSAVEKNVSEALVSPDGQKIALRGQDDNGWNLKLYDVGKSVTSKLAGERDLSAKGTTFVDWKWQIDSKKLDVSASSTVAVGDYTIMTDKNPAQVSKIKTATTTAEQIASTELDGNSYYIGPDGSISKKDSSSNITKISPATITISPDSKYRLWVFNDYYFVSKDSELYVLKPGTDSFEKIFNELVSDVKISPDNKKVVYASGSEIWIFFLKDESGQPVAKAGDQIFIARLSEKIANCDWFNSDYLILTAGNTIKTAEIDNRDKVNIVDLAKFSAIDNSADGSKVKLFWNSEQKSAYLFLGSALYKSQPIQ